MLHNVKSLGAHSHGKANPNFDYLTNIFVAFPNMWKISRIIPIGKDQNTICVQYYQPKSILPFLAKVSESIILKQIIDYLNANDLTSPLLSGFRTAALLLY